MTKDHAHQEKQAIDIDLALCERDHFKEQVNALAQQRDALVEACEDLANILSEQKAHNFNILTVHMSFAEKFLDALSKAKGEGS